MLSLRREEESLLEEVAAIHVAYQMIKTEVYWFVQLSQIFPDVIHDVPSAEVSMLYSGGEMVGSQLLYQRGLIKYLLDYYKEPCT